MTVCCSNQLPMQKYLQESMLKIIETCIQTNTPLDNMGVFVSYDMDITLEDINDITTSGVLYPIDQFIIEGHVNGRITYSINMDLVKMSVQDFFTFKNSAIEN